MNIYVLLRVILHSLLSVLNILVLTAAAWSILSQGEGQPRAAPGAVLVIISSVAFVGVFLMIWAECCIPRTLMSRVRTELALVLMLIVFQLISAVIVTINAVQSVCRDPTSCVTLLVLSWIAPFCLTMYYLIVLAVVIDHAKTNPNIWDASALDHPWFFRPPHPPPKTLIPLRRGPSISPPTSLRTQPSVPEHRRQRSSWMPSSPLPPLPPIPAAYRTSAYSAQSRTSLRSLSFYIPKWARELRPLRRGVEAPFPVRTRTPTNRWEDPRRIDAPVSPSLYSEFP